MKKIKLLSISILSAFLLLVSCNKDDSDPIQILGSFILDGELNFLDIEIGESETNELSILNNSENPIEIFSISLPNNAFQVSWDSGIIEPGASQFIDVTFTPTAIESYSGELVIENDTYFENNNVFINANGIENQNPINHLSGIFMMVIDGTGSGTCDDGSTSNEGGTAKNFIFNNDNTITFVDDVRPSEYLNDFLTVNNYTYDVATNTITSLNITLEFLVLPYSGCSLRTITINIINAVWVPNTSSASGYYGNTTSTVVHPDCSSGGSVCTFPMRIFLND